MTRRIIAVVIGVTILAVAAFFVPAAFAIKASQEREELLELQREASIIAGRVPNSGPIDEAVLRPIVDAEHRLGLYDRDGTLLGGHGPEEPDAIVQLGLRGAFAEGSVGDVIVAVVPLRVEPDGSSLAMRIEAERDSFLPTLLALGAAALVIVLVALAVAVWLAHRLNRPIERLRGWAADGIENHSPPPSTGIVEIDALRSALVESRNRIELLLDRERSFSSHVSHQLRTPVTAMRVAIETEQAAPRPEPDDLFDEIIAELDRLESTISSLLALARHPDRAIGTSDLATAVAAAAQRWQRLADDAGRQLTTSSMPTPAWCDPESVGHVIDVLLDNALRHGRGTIVITCRPVGDRAVLDVADAGPSSAVQCLLTDDSGTADSGTADSGATPRGIGLALALRLAETGGGSLTLVDAPHTTFRLDLPGGPPSTDDRRERRRGQVA